MATPVPKFSIDALERDVDALVSQGVKDLEIELCEQRSVIRKLGNLRKLRSENTKLPNFPNFLKFYIRVAVLRQPNNPFVTLSHCHRGV